MVLGVGSSVLAEGLSKITPAAKRTIKSIRTAAKRLVFPPEAFGEGRIASGVLTEAAAGCTGLSGVGVFGLVVCSSTGYLG